MARWSLVPELTIHQRVSEEELDAFLDDGAESEMMSTGEIMAAARQLRADHEATSCKLSTEGEYAMMSTGEIMDAAEFLDVNAPWPSSSTGGMMDTGEILDAAAFMDTGMLMQAMGMMATGSIHHAAQFVEEEEAAEAAAEAERLAAAAGSTEMSPQRLCPPTPPTDLPGRHRPAPCRESCRALNGAGAAERGRAQGVSCPVAASASPNENEHKNENERWKLTDDLMTQPWGKVLLTLQPRAALQPRSANLPPNVRTGSLKAPAAQPPSLLARELR